MKPDVTNVHQALQQASIETQKPDGPAPMRTGTYRIEAETKLKAEAICRRHGTSLSAYLRACCDGLVRDYQEPLPDLPCEE
jgi:hypothetical protein